MVKRWNYRQERDYDNLEKFGKMRTRSKQAKTSKQELSEDFILKENKWPVVEKAFAARVVEVHKRNAFVSPEPQVGDIQTTDVWMAKVAGKFFTTDRSERNFISVGDRVLCGPAEGRDVEPNSDLPQCVILHMAPRVSRIGRVDPMYPEREHVLASNVDNLLIVASFLSPRIKWGLIDRYLVLAELQGIAPIIILNKMDLLEEKRASQKEFVEECLHRAAYYESLGYKVFILQANEAKTLKNPKFVELVALLKDKVSMFSGHSGVGKSSIVNLLNPEIVQDVEPDSEIFYKGRHTTSYASFIKLGVGGYVIDTPGIRSFVIQQQGAIELTYGYRDFRMYAPNCKFRECGHIDEPDCAVIKAVADKHIPEWRYKHYTGILLGTSGREGRIRDQDRGRHREDEDIEEEDPED